VYCCGEAFKQIPRGELFSVHDFYCLLQLICPDIPLSLIQDSALTGCHAVGDKPILYKFDELSISLYFRFIFTEWLIMLENLFFEGRTRRASITVPFTKLTYKFEEWHSSMPPSTSQPSLESLYSVIESLCLNARTDATFDDLISAMLCNPRLRADTVSYRPSNTSETLSLANLPGIASGNGLVNPGAGSADTDKNAERTVPSLPGIK
jgi:hypothetical protein